MGKPGVKPLPTAVKDARGTFVKDPKRKNHFEPEPSAGYPKKPDTVKKDPISDAFWDRACATLDDMNVLTTADTDVLESYALNEAQLRKAYERMNAEEWKNRSPAMVHWNKCMDRRLKLMAELGLTPSSRTRLTAAPKKKESSVEDFIESLGAGSN